MADVRSVQRWRTFGYGSKKHHQGTAGLSLWFHLPGLHFRFAFLTHSHLKMIKRKGIARIVCCQMSCPERLLGRFDHCFVNPTLPAHVLAYLLQLWHCLVPRQDVLRLREPASFLLLGHVSGVLVPVSAKATAGLGPKQSPRLGPRAYHSGQEGRCLPDGPGG